MKAVPAETVAQVIANEPLRGMPRNDDVKLAQGNPRLREILQRYLAVLFPHMAGFGTDYDVLDPDDTALDREAAEAAENYEALGLGNEIPVLEGEVQRFKEMRAALAFMFEEGLIRHDTVIPTRFLPDLFMAVPVWYHWMPADLLERVAATWRTTDPESDARTRYFCDLFPGDQRWCDTYQLWNRRTRTFKQYQGEMIPSHVARRMRTAVTLFDHVVIATPYHDQAGMDWRDVKWLRALDPYVLGFKKGVPYFFVLARFSDSGTYPLLNELVGDTIEFLRANSEALGNFNQISSPYWCMADGGIMNAAHPFGDYLQKHVRQLLAAFEAGNLFNWLRGEA
jgi:hypothetical protein